MSHVVLLGDSIFDNARYVPDRPPVIEQLRRALPQGWRATLLAVDGHQTADVDEQVFGMSADATHLFVSVGGNDALAASGVLREAAATVGDALALLAEVAAGFRDEYQVMLKAVLRAGKPTAVCTVYDSIPDLPQPEVTALALFNDVILRSAFLAGIPVIDLRLVCTSRDDYSPLSPIEPSFLGGAKIARTLAEVATTHPFSRRESTVYPGV